MENFFRVHYTVETVPRVSSPGRTTRRERKENGRAEDVEVQRRQIPRSTKWPILSSSSLVLFRGLCGTCRLDQQNSVRLVTLAPTG